MDLCRRVTWLVLTTFGFGVLSPLSLPIQSAHADGINHTITYSRNGGSGKIPKQSPLSQATIFTVASNSCTFKFGYTFVGWSDGTTRYLPGSSYTVGSSDITLTAQWAVSTKRVITYSIANGTGTLPTPMALQQGTTFTIPAGNGVTKAGFHFVGWSDGINTYQPGDSYTVGASKILFTAQWMPTL